jgi:pimeloyl-ACP methyl ester carboxylesterase
VLYRFARMAYVRTRLGRWFYEERGTAQRAGQSAIVLLHGLLFDGGMWAKQIEALAPLGRIVVFDGPGHGKSTELPPPFSLEDHSDALMDAFGELRIDRAVLVGLSWGGMVAMRAGIMHPSRVKAMALLDTGADREPTKNRVKYRLMISFARRYGIPRWMVDREIKSILFGPDTLREQPELVDRFYARVNGFARDALSRAAKAVVVKRVSIVEKLARIEAPALVIHGRDDRARPPADAEQIVQHVKGARLEWIERCGHMSAIERPDAVNAALVPFVREHV